MNAVLIISILVGLSAAVRGSAGPLAALRGPARLPATLAPMKPETADGAPAQGETNPPAKKVSQSPFRVLSCLHPHLPQPRQHGVHGLLSQVRRGLTIRARKAVAIALLDRRLSIDARGLDVSVRPGDNPLPPRLHRRVGPRCLTAS